MLNFDSHGGNVSRTFDSDTKPRECIGHIRFIEQPDGKAGEKLYSPFPRGAAPPLFECRLVWN